MLGGKLIEYLMRDVRFSARLLYKSPGFALTAILTLTFAIGANAVVFSVLNGLILRPLNLPREESLYSIDRNGTGFQSYPDYLDMRDRNRSFEDLIAYDIDEVGLDTGEGPSRVWTYETSGNYFDGLGIQPYLGRVYHSSDEHGTNSTPYIVLSYAYWHARFQDDRSVVGRVVQLNKHPFIILGVTPPQFHGTLVFFSPPFFVPMMNHEQLDSDNPLTARGKRWIFSVMGRLKSKLTPAQAIADLNSIGLYLEKTYPKDDGKTKFTLTRPGLYGDVLGPGIRAFLAGLMLLAGLILLAACANLGSLFAARAADRSREVALRLALGSSRGRILRQLLTEAMLISMVGGALGLVGSVALLHRLSTWQPFPRFPMNLPVTPDAKVYGVALVLAVVSGILFGIVPVRQVLRATPYEIVKGGASSVGGRRITARDLLLVAQIAMCALLVTASLVAVRGLMRSLHSNFGFEPQNAMLADTSLTMGGYTSDNVPTMQKRMINALQTIPGAKSVGLVSGPPLSLGNLRATIFTDDTTDLRPANAAARPYEYFVSPEYFDAAGTTLLAGRTFSWHDDKDSQPVAVVNQEFARKIFGSITGATGRYYKRGDGTRIQVVGIVENGKYFNLAEDPQAAMFLPILQSPSDQTWLVVRSNRDPQQLAVAMRSKLRELDEELPFEIQTWTKGLDGVLFPSRMATVSLGVLGAMGAMLSITGIFGMSAYSVSKRWKELGIRIALGAQRKEVLQAALGRAFKLLAFGSATGLALGLVASRVLALIVYHATPRDPLVLAGVAITMSLLGLLATWIPAQRALGINPLLLLRTE